MNNNCEDNKGKTKNYFKKYYEKNKEKIYKKQNEWRENNKEKWVKSLMDCRKRRVEKLKEDGCVNPWGVVIKGSKPKYRKEV